MMSTVDETRRSLGHRKNVIRASIKGKKLGPSLRSAIDFHMVLLIMYKRKRAVFNCGHYYVVVDVGQIYHPETRILIGYRNVNLNFLYPIEFLVLL